MADSIVYGNNTPRKGSNAGAPLANFNVPARRTRLKKEPAAKPAASAASEQNQAPMPQQERSTDRQHSASAEVRALRCVVEDMDALAQGGFSEIVAIARLALCRLETPEGYQHLSMDDIAIALEVIWGKAIDIQNCINGEAERVGCSYVNTSKYRRWDAQQRAREEEVARAMKNAMPQAGQATEGVN